MGLTQETVAELAGISTRWYQQIESGRRTPSGRLLLRLCAILQIDARLFYGTVGLDPAQLNWLDQSDHQAG
ncbi:helix-turn-helix transcriptional regulator [Fournierella massiliensis]|nr:helix-turn-helix transcriptional regulator [Fournierella massiliensis]